MQNINLKMKIGIIIMAIIAIITVGGYIFKSSTEESEYGYYEENSSGGKSEEQEGEVRKVTVHVTGEVNYPGVVVLKEGERVVDAIEAAGGEKEEADLNKLNLAYVLSDGEKIYVPNKNDDNENIDYVSAGGGENVSTGNESEKNTIININTATVEELVKLPGVGEATANKIIAYRKENGKFEEAADIKNVPGIGDSKFENMKQYIRVK